MFAFYFHSFLGKAFLPTSALGFLKTPPSLVVAGKSEKLSQVRPPPSSGLQTCDFQEAPGPAPSVSSDRKPPGWQVLVLACIRGGLGEHGRLGSLILLNSLSHLPSPSHFKGLTW